MTWRGVIFQALASTAVWGLLMTGLFGWPRDAILVPMVMFGLLMFAILGTIKMVRERRSGK